LRTTKCDKKKTAKKEVKSKLVFKKAVAQGIS
jgi:hypothetical protein